MSLAASHLHDVNEEFCFIFGNGVIHLEVKSGKLLFSVVSSVSLLSMYCKCAAVLLMSVLVYSYRHFI